MWLNDFKWIIDSIWIFNFMLYTFFCDSQLSSKSFTSLLITKFLVTIRGDYWEQTKTPLDIKPL